MVGLLSSCFSGGCLGFLRREASRRMYGTDDWPLVLLRDAATGLPALPFDLEIEAGVGAA